MLYRLLSLLIFTVIFTLSAACGGGDTEDNVAEAVPTPTEVSINIKKYSQGQASVKTPSVSAKQQIAGATTTPVPPTATPVPPTIVPALYKHQQYVLIEELDCSGSPENIVIKNTMPDDEELDLGRWTIENRNKGNKFTFPAVVIIPAGASVNVISGIGVGTQNRTTFQWGTAGEQQWEDGDTAILINSATIKITERDCSS